MKSLLSMLLNEQQLSIIIILIIMIIIRSYQDLTKTLKQLVGNRYRLIAAHMQKSVVTIYLHIARSFKVLVL